MITGEIAILFASAAGIGAAAATWVYDRRLTKRLTDLRRDVDYLKDRVRDVDYLKDRVRENRERLDKTATAIAALQRVANRELPKDLYAKVADDNRTDLAKAKALGIAYGVRPAGKSPDLAASYKGEPYEERLAPIAKHPLYAKTGLPNQPVASLRPDTPAPNWDCPNCSYRSYQPQRWIAPRCPICKGLET
ncbi:hypothetical protein UFOVP786_30 [uncultured Caudovirales phage]|uniref:Uncharacterized protein n=1 Tax=uncultured Caudovirales phage TaxID=2100421 RepID=A0A6J5NY89_9CAUD|nr:hypothetical protein UFOVP786_30 [uncultured Caudovirales phage]